MFNSECFPWGEHINLKGTVYTWNILRHSYKGDNLCDCLFVFPLRKHAYSNILKIVPPKNENEKSSFQISAQNTDCGYLLEPPRRGGSNEYPQFTF